MLHNRCDMSNALMKRSSNGSSMDGVVPAVASAVIPGLGQLINKQSDKAIGVFAVVVGGWLLSFLPLVGWIPWMVSAVAWLYGIIDGYVTGKKKELTA
jgi:TM2 domain-containing membrane protein YozV